MLRNVGSANPEVMRILMKNLLLTKQISHLRGDDDSDDDEGMKDIQVADSNDFFLQAEQRAEEQREKDYQMKKLRERQQVLLEEKKTRENKKKVYST